MKIKVWHDRGHWHRPFHKGCDDICNPVLTLAIPFVGGVDVYLPAKRSFQEGLWVTSSGCGGDRLSFGVYSYGDNDVMVTADIEVTQEEWDAEWVSMETEHPRLWTDAEIKERGVSFEVWIDEADGFVPISAEEAWKALGRWPGLFPNTTA